MHHIHPDPTSLAAEATVHPASYMYILHPSHAQTCVTCVTCVTCITSTRTHLSDCKGSGGSYIHHMHHIHPPPPLQLQRRSCIPNANPTTLQVVPCIEEKRRGRQYDYLPSYMPLPPPFKLCTVVPGYKNVIGSRINKYQIAIVLMTGVLTTKIICR